MKDSLALIIFGITSNLAQIKLIPALYDLVENGLLPSSISIIGAARRKMDKEEFKKYIDQVLHQENFRHRHPIREGVFKKLISKMHYISGSLEDTNFYLQLKSFLNQLSRKGKKCNNRIFYLATYPDLYRHAFKNLKKSNLNVQTKGWVRLIIEKPIGNDLASAKSLNSLLLKYFQEDQIYRLDHYLGKETIQNILTFRLGNSIFEPMVNSSFVDHIQISALESFGIGKRGGYYDEVGALKDVGQNHQLQMLAFATMDIPSEFNSTTITKERVKILNSLRPLTDNIVFGQYEGYEKEPNVKPGSKTDTFYAFKTFIDNERFKNIPIYIRAGKKIGLNVPEVAEISIVFKQLSKNVLKVLGNKSMPNVLIYRIQPNEGIVFKILTKKPGHTFELEPEYMQFCYKTAPINHYFPDPYERLLMEVIKGEQIFFNSAEEVEAQWAFTDSLADTRGKPLIYKPGTWGPKEADELLKKDGRMWLEPSMEFCRI